MACRLRVYDTALCLLSAHLSSGENEGDELKRNYDYSEIVRRGAFPADVAAVDPAAALPGQQQDGVAKVCCIQPSLAHEARSWCREAANKALQPRCMLLCSR